MNKNTLNQEGGDTAHFDHLFHPNLGKMEGLKSKRLGQKYFIRFMLGGSLQKWLIARITHSETSNPHLPAFTSKLVKRLLKLFFTKVIERPHLTTIPNTEKRVEYMTRRRVILTSFSGVCNCGQTLSRGNR